MSENNSICAFCREKEAALEMAIRIGAQEEKFDCCAVCAKEILQMLSRMVSGNEPRAEDAGPGGRLLRYMDEN